MILQRYIFKELVVTFLLAFLVLNMVCAVGLIFQMFRTYDRVGLDFILKAIPMAFSYMAPWALLVSATLAGTMVYGRMGAENEIDAMRASGIHVGRIIAPSLLFAIFVLGCAFLTHNELASWGRYRQRALKSEVGQFGLQNPPPGKQNLTLGKQATLSYVDAQEGVLHRPFLFLRDDEGKQTFKYSGLTGRVEFKNNEVIVTFYTASVTQYDPNTGKESSGPLGSTATYNLKMDDPFLIPKSPADMPGLELLGTWVRTTEPSLKRDYYTELHLRFAKSLGPVCMVLLAVPIGIFVRKGTRMAGLGIAIPPIIGFLILSFLGESLASKELVAPEVGAYGPDVIVLICAGILIHKVMRV